MFLAVKNELNASAGPCLGVSRIDTQPFVKVGYMDFGVFQEYFRAVQGSSLYDYHHCKEWVDVIESEIIKLIEKSWNVKNNASQAFLFGVKGLSHFTTICSPTVFCRRK